jgi:hypothetical protein
MAERSEVVSKQSTVVVWAAKAVVGATKEVP